jgi:hypothetical protein
MAPRNPSQILPMHVNFMQLGKHTTTSKVFRGHILSCNELGRENIVSIDVSEVCGDL